MRATVMEKPLEIWDKRVIRHWDRIKSTCFFIRKIKIRVKYKNPELFHNEKMPKVIGPIPK